MNKYYSVINVAFTLIETLTTITLGTLIAGLLLGFYFGYFKITTSESKTIFTKIEMLQLEREIKSFLKESDSFVITVQQKNITFAEPGNDTLII